METLLLDILESVRSRGLLDEEALAKIVRAHNKGLRVGEKHFAKKQLLPYYLAVKELEPNRWQAWQIDEATEKTLIKALQVKPRRTASGVATITVITKPWPCAHDCLYCPNDLRMPKSYLHDEPACQRAERNFFDPYLQVISRLRALTHMGHDTDKIELIVLGGTWSDYPEPYRIWFITELFRALNEGDSAVWEAAEPGSTKTGFEANVAQHPCAATLIDASDIARRRNFYASRGLSDEDFRLANLVAAKQDAINSGVLSYNQAMMQLYGDNSIWGLIANEQVSNFHDLACQQHINETAQHRVVGLSIETRPDAITCESLVSLRRLGCTKVQIGIQSLNTDILALNNRKMDIDVIGQAFDLLRVFGFKIHAHFMVNLYGSTPEQDKADYLRFVSDSSYQPDEIKLYPCSLVNGSGLCDLYAKGMWRPYSEEELLGILEADVLATPPFMRISRMIRDISATDILVGNKKTNLRQIVEGKIKTMGVPTKEIRSREIGNGEVDFANLHLEEIAYDTTASKEYFLQWVTEEGKIAGFLRLSLPDCEYLKSLLLSLRPSSYDLYASLHVDVPIKQEEAMIREVHVYGRVAQIKDGDQKTASGNLNSAVSNDVSVKKEANAQHLGLGRHLIKHACAVAKTLGYKRINVISSVGTKEYYRSLGFVDNGLYQQMVL